MKKRHAVALAFLLSASVDSCAGGGGVPATPVSADAARTKTDGLAPQITHAIAIDAGGDAAANDWQSDTDYSVAGLSGVERVSRSIDTSRVVGPAPQAVYQTQRWCAHLTYAIPNLAPAGAYTVRLHFVESYFTAARRRVFNVTINGVRVLTNFDIFSSAGGADRAFVQAFGSGADTSGKITIRFDASVNNASIAGIEIAAASAAPATSAQPGFGPRVPVGPQASITCAPNSVALSPGSDVPSIVGAHPAGTQYCFAAGTYARVTLVPKAGDRYVGLLGATLDGQNAATHAFSGSAPGVTIENFAIEHYNSPTQDAPIDPGMTGATTNWLISNNEVANNASAGIDAAGGDRIVANYIHDNGQEGYKANGTGEVWTDNEISHNNPADANDPTNEAGGGKAWATIGLVMDYNYVHDNHGPGIWQDTDNQGTVLEYNDVENNMKMGIVHEVSWDATIAYNYLKGNASSRYCAVRNYWCADITIANSGGVNGKIVDVHDNTLIPNGYEAAVMLYSEFRGFGLFGARLVRNVHVHNNTADLSLGGIDGAVDHDGTDGGIFTSQGNSFDYNAYTGAGSSAFYWDGSSGAFSFFRGLGEELHGTSQPAQG
jgi:hypothetical protein